MRILYVVSRPLEINTSASIRNRATLEGLLNLGHDVDLITTEYDEKHSNFDEGIKIQGLNVKYLRLNGIQDVARIGRKLKFLKPLKKFVYKIMSEFEIYDNLKGIANYSLRMNISDNDYDLIISTSDPKSSHLFISKMFENGLLKKIPWIQIWGDPFLSDITRKNLLWSSKVRKEEDRLLRYATKIVYVSKLTLIEQQKSYSNFANKMTYEPIPYIKKEIYPVLNTQEESLTFLYCGDYSSEIRNLRPFYEAIKNTKHKLIICGDSDISFENTERIKVYPRVSFEKTKEFESKCDVLVHLSNLKGTQIPGKIYQYSGTNKLILFILDGNTETLKQVFERYNRYIFSENNQKNITETINDVDKGKYIDTGFVLEEFNPIKIAERIIKI